MNYKIESFCEIIKNALFSNRASQLDAGVDWSYMIRLANEHNLLPIFIEEAIKYPSYVERPEHIDEMQQAFAIVASQVKRTEAFLKLYRAFIENDIYPLVMKGLICRQLYGSLSDHRPSSDEDILIRPNEYLKAKEILVANGYMPLVEDDIEEHLEQIQEISFIHPEEKLNIELHINPFGTENEARTYMNDYFKNAFDNYREINVNGVLIRTLNHHDHLLFLIFHAFRHFMGGGFGMRQMLDILLYQKYYGSEIDVMLLNEQLKRFRADIFWADMIHIGNKYLGFELLALVEQNCPQELLEDMILCGVFGNKTQAERTATVTTLVTTENYLKGKKSNPIAMIWKSIFPGRTYLLGVAPYLRNKPWLLPIAWVQRWSRFLVKNRKSDNNLAAETMKISQRRLRLLKKYDLA